MPDIKTQNTIQNILCNNKNLAFILGNGINHYAYRNDNTRKKYVGWNSLIKNLWEGCDIDFNLTSSMDSIEYAGILLTEIYDLIYVKDVSYTQHGIKKMVLDYFERYKINISNDYHKALKDSLIRWDVPVLTMNFDNNLDDGLKRTILTHPDEAYRKGFTSYYPWNVVYSDKNVSINNVHNTFGIWHVNGMLTYQDSLRLGLSDYMGQVEKARSMINGMNSKGEDDSFSGKYMNRWKGYNTWLHILFNKELCIAGLSLDINENFLRWLLIERQKYYKKFRDRGVQSHRGWYFHCNVDGKISDGKRLFLSSVGLEVVEFDSYREIYEDFLLLQNG